MPEESNRELRRRYATAAMQSLLPQRKTPFRDNGNHCLSNFNLDGYAEAA